MRELKVGLPVAIKNQTGNKPTKWDKTGIVLENNPHSQVKIKVDGSHMVTTLNRQFVKPLYHGLKRLSVLPSSDTTVNKVNKSNSSCTADNEATTEDIFHSKTVKDHSEGWNGVSMDEVISPDEPVYRGDSSSKGSALPEISTTDR